MIDLTALDHFRDTGPAVMARYGSSGDATCGAFFVPRGKTVLVVIAANGLGWDHLSVSLPEERRTPTWDEMEFVKRLFFKPEETAMQLHVPTKNHINNHPHVLHLWRSHTQEIPLPPGIMV